jgi:hypothetical protein
MSDTGGSIGDYLTLFVFVLGIFLDLNVCLIDWREVTVSYRIGVA